MRDGYLRGELSRPPTQRQVIDLAAPLPAMAHEAVEEHKRWSRTLPLEGNLEPACFDHVHGISIGTSYTRASDFVHSELWRVVGSHTGRLRTLDRRSI